MTDRKITRIRHAVLRLGERNYTFDINHMLEIVSGPVLEPCLDGPELLIGEFESPVGLLPVLDLLNRPPDDCNIARMSLVVLEDSSDLFCLLADEVLDYIDLDLNQRCPLPEGANGVPTELLNGVINLNNNDYYLLDLGVLRTAWNSVGEPTGTG